MLPSGNGGDPRNVIPPRLSEIISPRLRLIAGGCPLKWVWKAVSNYCNINQALACYHKVNLSGGGQRQLEVPLPTLHWDSRATRGSACTSWESGFGCWIAVGWDGSRPCRAALCALCDFRRFSAESSSPESISAVSWSSRWLWDWNESAHLRGDSNIDVIIVQIFEQRCQKPISIIKYDRNHTDSKDLLF